MKQNFYSFFATIAILFASTNISTVHAATCGLPADGLDTSDVTFRGNDADGCAGLISGNDSLTDVNDAGNDLFFGGTDWLYALKDDIPGSSPSAASLFFGVNWTIDVDSGSDGDWTLTVTDPLPADLPISVDFLIVVKAKTEWAAYLFDDESFLTEGVDSGTFAIKIANKKGIPADISHLSLYLRAGSSSITTTTEETINPVPEPSILFLLGSVMIGIGFIRARS